MADNGTRPRNLEGYLGDRGIICPDPAAANLIIDYLCEDQRRHINPRTKIVRKEHRRLYRKRVSDGRRTGFAQYVTVREAVERAKAPAENPVLALVRWEGVDGTELVEARKLAPISQRYPPFKGHHPGLRSA